MATHRVEIPVKPSHKSVQTYIKYLKKESPGAGLKNELIESDIQCVCCGQGAPSEAAALCKVEDHTPTTVNLKGTAGKQIWLCADCYTYGVRPKYVKYGEVAWNQEGRKISKRAESKMGHPW